MARLHDEELDIMEDMNNPYWGPPLGPECAEPSEVLYVLLQRAASLFPDDRDQVNFLSSVARSVLDHVREAKDILGDCDDLEE
jgi:hypothetical protein